jgi:mRNA degradation ribonuclease J1/J2
LLRETEGVPVALEAEGNGDLSPKSLEAAAVASATVSAWREEAGDVLDEEKLSGAIQREVRQLFRHSISRRPSIWPQIIFLPGSGPGQALRL